MNNEGIEQRLVAAGVAPNIAAYVAAQKPLRWYLGGWFFIGVMIGGFAIGGLILWPWLEHVTNSNAIAEGRAHGAILYYQNFGFGLLIGLFAWIVAAAAIIGLLPLLSPRLTASAFVESVLDSAKQSGSAAAARKFTLSLLQRHASELDPAKYVRAVTTSWTTPFVIAACVLILIAVVATARDTHGYSLYTPTQYIQHNLLPIQTKPRLWASAVRLEVGCNHVTGRDASDDPVYKVTFSDGSSTRLEGATPLADGSWLDEVEKIDAQIVAAQAQIRPWQWLGRKGADPDCLAAQRRRLSEADYWRLLRLLRQ